MQSGDEDASGSAAEKVEGVVTVVAAVERDLKLMPTVAESALAASALVLAAQLDDPDTSATSKSMCSRELRDTMTVLRALAPAKREADGIDDITAQRNKRIAGRSASAP